MNTTRTWVRSAVLAAMLCAGCAGVAPEGSDVLARADKSMIGGDYESAIRFYEEFAAGHPGHEQATRARATQMVLKRMLAAQAEMGRAQRGGDTVRRELGERQAEADRLKGEADRQRAETDRLRAEVAKLRADMERLRNIDLQALPK
ncbi:MAG TPA: hypothetical protein VM164_08625 [Burkholderiales bacterium]|nr:hypothetical protein [Burkholderiales bacterium]